MINEILAVSLACATIGTTGILANCISIKASLMVLFPSMVYSNFYYTEHATNTSVGDNDIKIQDIVVSVLDSHTDGALSNTLNDPKVVEQQNKFTAMLTGGDANDQDLLNSLEGEFDISKIQKELGHFAEEVSEDGLNGVDFCNKEKYSMVNSIVAYFEEMMLQEAVDLPNKKKC